ncbi:MAG: hypothetical protein AAF809_08490 [Bacteroidota bacterium]
MRVLLLTLTLAGWTGCTVAFPLGVYLDSRIDASEPIAVEEAVTTEPGHTLRVTQRDDTEVVGPLVRVEPDAEPRSLVLRVRTDEVPVPLANISAVERYDPPPNLWSAAAIGAGVDLILLVFVSPGDDWCFILGDLC